MIRKLLLAAALTIGLSTPARAGPVVGAIAAVLGGGALATTIASAITNMVVGLALSVLSRALAPKQRTPGIKTDYTSTGETTAQSFILGRYATGGNFVAPPMSHGSDNKTLNYVVDLADMPIEGLTKVYIDGEAVTFNGAESAHGWGPTGDGRFAGKAWLKFYDGSQTAADPELLDRYGSDPERPWSADMILRGVPYVILTFYYDRGVYSGLPRVRFEADGIPLYDPRLDTTAGGAGAHRWADPSTWAWTENPAVMAYNILRGITLPDGSVWGMGAASGDLPLSAWFAAMNACDEDVPLDGGGTEKRYRAGYEVKVDEEPLAVIEELMRACGGEVLEFGGYWHITVGAPPSATLSITDDDLIVSSPRDYEPFPGLAETYNAVHAVYPSPANGWDPTDAIPLYNPAWEAEDGGRRLVADLQLDAVPYDTQVRRVMRELAQDNRRFAVHVVTLPPDALATVPLQTISWTSAHNGYTAKLFEVVRKVIDPETLLSTLLIRERDPSDYDLDPADDAVIPTPPSRYIATPTIDGIDGWAVTAVAITDASGVSRRPALRMAWNTDIVAEAIAWLIRVKATGEEVARGTMQDLTAGQVTISEGILAATEYEVRGRAVSRKGTEWTVWSTVTTLDLRLGQADLGDDVTDALFPGAPGIPTGLAVGSSLASDGRAVLTADWNDVSGAVQYEIGISENGGAEVILLAGTSYFSETDLRPNTAFSVRVRAVGSLGDKSPWSGAVTHTTVKDTTPPPTPTLLPITAGIGVLWLEWTLSEPNDLSHYEIVERTTNSAPGASTTPTFTSPAKIFARAGVDDQITRYYWVRAIDTSGNKSGWSSVQSATPAVAPTPEITTEALQGLVDKTSFATGIGGVEVVSSLPTTGNFPGRTVVLTTDGKLYRYLGSPPNAFVKEVDGADLKANSVTTGAVAAGAINTEQLAAGAVLTKNLGVGDFTNYAAGSDFEDAAKIPWDLGAGMYRTTATANSGAASLRIDAGAAVSKLHGGGIPCQPGDQFYVSFWSRCSSAWDGQNGISKLRFGTSVVGGTLVGSIPYNNGESVNTWIERNGVVTVPTGVNRIYATLDSDATAGSNFIDDIVIRRMNGGELIVDGALLARHVGTNEIIANTANIKNGVITDAKVANLSAAKLLAGTALAGSLTVSGTALSSVRDWANNPAARINAASTQILPGKIVVSGSTTLEDWRKAGDTTKIDGGKIATNSITALQVETETLTANEIVAEGITRQGSSGNGVLITNNSAAYYTTVAEFTLPSVPLSSYVQGIASFTLDTDPSNLPAGFEIRVRVNNNVVVLLNQSSISFTGSGQTFHVRPFTEQNVPAGDVTVDLKITGMGGYGILRSNLSAVAAMR